MEFYVIIKTAMAFSSFLLGKLGIRFISTITNYLEVTLKQLQEACLELVVESSG